MDSKVRIGAADTRAADATACAEKERADGLARELSAVRMRLRKFHSKIECVVFPDAGVHTPPWAETWLDWLITGNVPAPLEVEKPPVEVVDGLDGKAASNEGVQAGEVPA